MPSVVARTPGSSWTPSYPPTTYNWSPATATESSERTCGSRPTTAEVPSACTACTASLDAAEPPPTTSAVLPTTPAPASCTATGRWLAARIDGELGSKTSVWDVVT